MHIKAGKSSYCVAGETRTLLNSSLRYHLFSREAKKQNQTKPHIGLGHIINLNTGVGFQWREENILKKKKKKNPQTQQPPTK